MQNISAGLRHGGRVTKALSGGFGQQVFPIDLGILQSCKKISALMCLKIVDR